MNKEELIFNLKKDTPYKNSREFKEDVIKKLKIKDIDFKEVYARIINHQIKKYGGSLGSICCEKYIKGDGKEKSIRARDRRSKRRNYESKRRYYD